MDHLGLTIPTFDGPRTVMTSSHTGKVVMKDIKTLPPSSISANSSVKSEEKVVKYKRKSESLIADDDLKQGSKSDCKEEVVNPDLEQRDPQVVKSDPSKVEAECNLVKTESSDCVPEKDIEMSDEVPSRTSDSHLGYSGEVQGSKTDTIGQSLKHDDIGSDIADQGSETDSTEQTSKTHENVTISETDGTSHNSGNDSIHESDVTGRMLKKPYEGNDGNSEQFCKKFKSEDCVVLLD